MFYCYCIKMESKNSYTSKKSRSKEKVNNTRTVAERRPKLQYTVQPIVPAQKAELLSVAKAMHRENFGERVKDLFSPETDAAIKALKTGIYVGWRIPGQTWDCIRVNEHSFCFCGHKLYEHKPYDSKNTKAACMLSDCKCKFYRFIPSRPEDVGEFWLKRRRDFDASKWRAKCRCKHPHTVHSESGLLGCKFNGCGCRKFDSNFLCAACDQHWEQHETFFDTDSIRKEKGLPHGSDYLPFAELPSLRNMALTGQAHDGSAYFELTGIDESMPAIDAKRVTGNDVPFRP